MSVVANNPLPWIGLCRTSVLEERQESGVSFTKIDCYYRANRKGNENRGATRETHRGGWQRNLETRNPGNLGGFRFISWFPAVAGVLRDSDAGMGLQIFLLSPAWKL